MLTIFVRLVFSSFCWICLRCLEKVKYSVKWWFEGDLPWYEVDLNNHLKQIQVLISESHANYNSPTLKNLMKLGGHALMKAGFLGWLHVMLHDSPGSLRSIHDQVSMVCFHGLRCCNNMGMVTKQHEKNLHSKSDIVNKKGLVGGFNPVEKY